MKRTAICIALIFMATSLFAQTTFTGEAGIKASAWVEDYEKNVNGVPVTQTALSDSVGAYVDAQLDFGNVFFFRSEFTAITLPLHMDNSVAEKETNAVFSVEEVSATLKLGTSGISNYISLFYGDFEAFGSDIYIQRHLGINPITSEITRTNFAINTCKTSIPVRAGLCYTLDPRAPISFSTTLFADYDVTVKDLGGGNMSKIFKPEFNGELRLAGAFPRLEFDSKASVTVRTDENISTVDGVFLDSGFNLLFGNPLGSSIYMQAFIQDYDILALALPELSSMDAILEFRISTALNSLNLSLYGFGKDYLANSNLLGGISYTDYMIGGGINFKTRQFLVSQNSIQAGFHVNFSFMDPDFSGFMADIPGTLTSWDSSFLVSPYLEYQFVTGKAYVSVQGDIWKMLSDPVKAIKAYASASFYF